MTTTLHIQEFHIDVSVRQLLKLRNSWLRYEIFDATLVRIAEKWENSNVCKFTLQRSGVYILRVVSLEEIVVQRIIKLSDNRPTIFISFGEADYVGNRIKTVALTRLEKSDYTLHSNALKPVLKAHEALYNSNLRVTSFLKINGGWERMEKLTFYSSVIDMSTLVTQIDTGSSLSGLLVDPKNDISLSRFIMLPAGGVKIKIKSDISLGNETGLKLEIWTNNPKADALGKLLVKGDVESAQSLVHFEGAERLMQDKMTDHAAAAIGGYYLLRFRQFEYLHNWTVNLATWFPTMPDGAIIHAWFVLQQESGRLPLRLQTSQLDVEHPYEGGEGFRYWLLQAASRGIPLCSEGLRLLYEGLTQVMYRKKGKDPPVAIARKKVKKYMVRLVPGQLYTTLNNYSPSDDM